MLLTGPLPVAKARLISTPTNLNSIGLSIRKVRMVMRKLKPDQAGRDVHVSSPAPVSGPSGYHRIAESAESHSVPRRSWSGLTATQVGPGQESLPGAPTFWPCAPFYLPSFALKNAVIPPILPLFFAALRATTSTWLGPTPWPMATAQKYVVWRWDGFLPISD
jgi:hypothetical protein